MTAPIRMNSSWFATLGDDQLLAIEKELHASFLEFESAEKRRRGARYALLRGSETLVNAWLQWQLASNETRTRGLVAFYQR